MMPLRAACFEIWPGRTAGRKDRDDPSYLGFYRRDIGMPRKRRYQGEGLERGAQKSTEAG